MSEMNDKEIEYLIKSASIEELKPRLFIEAIPEKTEQLKYMVFKKIGDIALTVNIMLNDKMTAMLHISKVISSEYSPEEVFNMAMENSLNFVEPVIVSLSIENISSNFFKRERFMKNEINPDDYTKELNAAAVTTETLTDYSASAIFYPGVAKRISDLFNTDKLFLCFTSRVECMVHYTNEDPTKLVKVLNESICEATDPDEVLSYNVFEYDRKTDSIKMITDK